MGVLVSFPRPTTPARAMVDGHSAAILFFTGVRYVRMDDAAMRACRVAAVPPIKKRRRAAQAKAPAAECLA